MPRPPPLDPPAPAPHDREPQMAEIAGAFEQRLPTLGEIGDRLDRNRVLGGARNIAEARGRADVERDDVVADRRMVPAQNLALAAVETDRLVMDQPRPGKARQPTQVDVAFLETVMPGDIARQHAGI